MEFFSRTAPVYFEWCLKEVRHAEQQGKVGLAAELELFGKVDVAGATFTPYGEGGKLRLPIPYGVIEELATLLSARLSRWVHGDEEGFRIANAEEAQELVTASFGEEILHTVGSVYKQQGQRAAGGLAAVQRPAESGPEKS